MISAFIQVNEGRKKLIEEADQLSQDQLFELAKTIVPAYQENQLAFNELLHYQENGKLLMKHPIFDEDNLKAEIEALSDVKALTEYKNLASQLSRLKKKLEKDPKDQDAKRKLQWKQTKRKLLYKKLNEKQIL